MDRRTFIKSLVAATAGVQVAAGEKEAVLHDRLGGLLPQRKLGNTGATVTMLGLGGWHIGRMNEKDAQETIEIALEGGVRFFDTAESYQNGGSEKRLGKLLVPKYRDQVFLMTKTTARNAETARKHLNASLDRLEVDRIDLWQIHEIGSPEDVEERIENGVLDVLLQARAEGKVRYIGFTGHRTPAAHQRMLEITKNLQTCQMPVNTVDPGYNSFIEQVLPELNRRDMGVLAMKTLANGGFFGGSRHGEHGDNPRLVPNHLTVEEALRFVWSLPVAVVISGPDNPSQFQEKIDLARTFQHMSETERQQLIEKVADFSGRSVEFYKT